MRPLTARQQEVLELLKRHLETTGMPPTRAEISRELGFKSPNAAEEHLKALARKGAIEIVAGASRGIRIIDDSANDEEEEGLPLIGRVAAGEPILAEQHIEGTYRVDANMFKPQADFFIKSIWPIHERYRHFRWRSSCCSQHKRCEKWTDCCRTKLKMKVTVKRLERKGSVIYLHAENEEFQPIVVNLEEQPHFEIEGIAVGIIRNNAWM